MLPKLSRLFVIKTRVEALFVIHALALGAVERGIHYLHQYHGPFGYALFGACALTVLMAGAKLLDSVTPPRPSAWHGPERRRGDRRQAPPRPA